MITYLGITLAHIVGFQLTKRTTVLPAVKHDNNYADTYVPSLEEFVQKMNREIAGPPATFPWMMPKSQLEAHIKRYAEYKVLQSREWLRLPHIRTKDFLHYLVSRGFNEK